jgi:hypothetical protein
VALVVVRARADHEHALAPGVTIAQRADVPGERGLAEAGDLGRGDRRVVSPMRSAALPQPLPSVRAMSWRSTPVRRAMSDAARAATSKGSAGVVEGFVSRRTSPL